MKIFLEGINQIKKRMKDGSAQIYYYNRTTKIRILGIPGTEEFARNYEQSFIVTEEKHSRDVKGKFASLILLYQGSAEFSRLANVTKGNVRQRLNVLNEAFGELDLRSFSNRKIRATVLAWRDAIAATKPSAAEHYIKQLKTLLNFAEERCIIDLNPLHKMKCLPSKNRSDCIWSADQIKRVLAVASKELQWAIKLALLTGQRKGDLIRLRWDQISNGFLRFTQGKTGAKMSIPLNAPLAALLAEIPRNADTILSNSLGGPWAGVSGLTHHWYEALELAGLSDEDLTFHDLRGTAVTVLADMGCTEAEIAAITGHSLEHVGRILKVYLKRTDTQATSAMLKLEGSWIGQLQTATAN